MPIELIQPLVTVIGLASNGYSFLSGISHGQQIKSMRRQIEALDGRVQTLSNNILYASSFQVLKNMERRITATEIGQRQILELLQPVQYGLQDPVLASRLIEAPAAFTNEMRSDPWRLLAEIRPLRLMIDCAHRGKVPVLFFDSGVPFVGWINSSALLDFNIRYCASTTFAQSNPPIKRRYVDLGTRRMGYLKVFNFTTRNISITCSQCSGEFEVTLQSNENYAPCPYCGNGNVVDVSW